MSKLSLREAAKRYDVSRPTLTKALNSGRLSGERDASGNWVVDASEVARLYTLRSKANKENTPKPQTNTAAQAEIATLKSQLEITQLRGELELERSKREAAERALLKSEALVERLLPKPTVPITDRIASIFGGKKNNEQ